MPDYNHIGVLPNIPDQTKETGLKDSLDSLLLVAQKCEKLLTLGLAV